MIDLLKAADAAFPDQADDLGGTYNSDDPTQRQQSIERLRACMPTTEGGHNFRTRRAASFFEGDNAARRAARSVQRVRGNATMIN